MLPAFQTYCLQQSTSVNMLNTLEKEKELLRYASSSSVTRSRSLTLGAFSSPYHSCIILNGRDRVITYSEEVLF